MSHPVFMRISSGTWVNLRLQDSTESEALAKLDAGTCVYVLCDQCSSENGWVRVWLLPQREYFDEGSVNEDGTARLWTEKDGVHPFGSRAAYIGLTGYIWHSFLEIIR